ncbi:MAG: hypothetical protein WC971_06875 [Coriobacteriia bacterium]
MGNSEVFRLILAVIVLPVIATFARRLRVVSTATPWAVGAVGAIYASYVFSLAENMAMGDVFNMMQHVMYGVAGVCVLRTAVVIRRSVVLEQERA